MSLTGPPIIKVRTPRLETASLWAIAGPKETDTLARLKAKKPANPPPLRLFLRTMLHVMGNVTMNFVPSMVRNAPFLFASGATLALCFAAGNPQMSLFFVVVPGVFGLAVSEAHIFKNPARNGASYQGVHVLFMLTGIVIVQTYQTLTVPALALSGAAVKFGLASSILTIMVFGIIGQCLRRRREIPVMDSARALSVICFLWIWAGAVLLKHNPLPEFFPYQQDLMDFVIVSALTVSLYWREGSLGGLGSIFITIREGFEIEDLTVTLKSMPMAAKGEPVNKYAQLLERLGLAGLLYWPVSAVYWVASGRVPLAQVDGLRWLSECIGLLALLCLWPVMRSMVTELKAAIAKKKK